MARYEIEIARTAEKQLKRLERPDQERVVRAILTLAGEPFPRGSRKLSGYEDVYRIRVGHFRVIYSVSGTTLIIIILKIGHRKDMYR
ncbi:MAG: type II toxin-antitoxin system RelE/ParE family toxin [Gemmatimonadales bacterium]|jgi:mRNA interferase RelE/StbE